LEGRWDGADRVLHQISETIRRIGSRPPTSQVGNDVPTAPDEGTWRQAIHELASFERPSASEGERRAAAWIAGRLRAQGCDAVIEREQAHGGYWWPIGLANLLALGGALLLAPRHGGKARRLGAALASGMAAAALWDDLGHGRRWFRRALLPKRATWNVIGEAGDRKADRTVVFVAHHDAAHSGLIFHPALGRFAPRFLPRLHERSSQTLPVLYGVWLGPLAIFLGAVGAGRGVLKAGSALALGAIVAMADIAGREVVPGANDNLAAVGVLLAIAERLNGEPQHGVRVLLLSTGSEESFSEGMQAFGERHFDELDPRATEFICLECLGGPTLMVLEGEGMLRMRAYPREMRDRLARAAAAAGVKIMRGLKTVGACDALIALRAGYPVATLASVDYTKLPINYHWPSDTAGALHWQTIEDAIRVCGQFLEEPASA
jgi:acetylornithine deacetylase/succinyl-diaminopimelate desuccinylase-like protein